MNADKKPAPNDELIQRITQIILENLNNEQFGVSELAQKIGINRSHLYRKVLVLTKKSLSQFIREIRLSEAQRILQEEEVTVSEAAYRVGFSNPSYFNTCFHDRYGFPPGEAKHMNLENSSGNKSMRKGASNLQAGTARKYVIPVFLVLLLIAIISITLILLYNRDNIEDKSIAVLPFINDSQNDSTTHLINGIMDEIMINLQTIKDLRVPGRTSVEQYRSTTKTIPEISEELGVSYILEGSAQIFGNKLVLRVQLIEGATGTHIWGTSIEEDIGSIESIIEIQSSIAELIARELKAVTTPEEKQLIEKIPTFSLTALDFYQRGSEEHVKYWLDSDNKEALERAEQLYFAALDIDPTFAKAYDGLAHVYRQKHYEEEVLTEYFLDSMLILANKALSYDRQLSEAYVTRGVYFQLNGKFKRAINEYDKAIEMNPNNWVAYWYKGQIYRKEDYVMSIENYLKAAQLHRGSFLSVIYREIGVKYNHAGFFEKAISYFNEALKLDNDSAAYYFRLAFVEDNKYNFENAIEFYKKSYTLDSTRINSFRVIGQNYLYLDQYKKALESFLIYEKEMKRRDMEVLWWSMPKVAYAYWINGFTKEAEFYTKRILEISDPLREYDRSDRDFFRWTFYNPASVFAFQADKRKAYEYLELGDVRNMMDAVTIKDLKYSPLFDNLRDDPEFQEILMTVEANYRTECEKVRKWLEENDLL